LLNIVDKKRVCDLCYKEHLAIEEAAKYNKARSLEYLETTVENRINEQEQWLEINADIDTSISHHRELLRSLKEDNAAQLASLRLKLQNERDKNERFVSVVASLQQAIDGAKRYNSATSAHWQEQSIQLSCLDNELHFLIDQRDTLQHQAFSLHSKLGTQINFTQVFMTCCRNCKHKFATLFRKQLAEANFSDNMSFVTNGSMVQNRRSSTTAKRSDNCTCRLM
jgi:hypothetical protein